MSDMTQTDPKAAAVKAKWIRGFYMLVFIICGWVAIGLTLVVTIFQFLSILLTDQHNENLRRFGNSLSQYFKQLVQYLTYNSNVKAFPFGAWPGDEQKEVHVESRSKNK